MRPRLFAADSASAPAHRSFRGACFYEAAAFRCGQHWYSIGDSKGFDAGFYEAAAFAADNPAGRFFECLVHRG